MKNFFLPFMFAATAMFCGDIKSAVANSVSAPINEGKSVTPSSMDEKISKTTPLTIRRAQASLNARPAFIPNASVSTTNSSKNK